MFQRQVRMQVNISDITENSSADLGATPVHAITFTLLSGTTTALKITFSTKVNLFSFLGVLAYATYIDSTLDECIWNQLLFLPWPWSIMQPQRSYCFSLSCRSTEQSNQKGGLLLWATVTIPFAYRNTTLYHYGKASKNNSFLFSLSIHFHGPLAFLWYSHDYWATIPIKRISR